MPSDFLRMWCAANLKDIPPGDRAQQASQFAAKCIADAAMCGIFIEDLEQAAGGSVVDYMAKAIEAADDCAVDDMLQRVRPRHPKKPEGPAAC